MCICYLCQQHTVYILSSQLHWSLSLSKVGSLFRIYRSMLKVDNSFELRILYNFRFIESEMCLPLFEYETQPEHTQKRSQICL